MTYRSYFGNQNSTLGSVVPLVMFLSYSSKSTSHSCQLEKCFGYEIHQFPLGSLTTLLIAHLDTFEHNEQFAFYVTLTGLHSSESSFILVPF